MSKKLMLLALAVVSAGLFAVPTVALANEIHFDTATTFTGTGGASSLVTSGEPTITCESIDYSNGTLSAGGTTGTMTLVYTGCHTSVFGFTAKCHTTGSAADNTVVSGGTLHIFTSFAVAPRILVTMNPTEIICAGISNTYVEGSLIGTITSPACGTSSNKLTLSFAATGSTQNHLEYTGSNYDLIARTGGKTGSPLTSGLTGTASLTANTAGTLTCT
ncbi:MAG TPA: hypothetical protein VNC15_11020 [Solirubrobacterales bacterium]|nr:hypothetical protein [Solirubrobacterales bacterium]